MSAVCPRAQACPSSEADSRRHVRRAPPPPTPQALLARSLPPGVLHQQTAVERLEEGPAGITLHFAGGCPPVTARLALGADGSQSFVRQLILGDGPPLYAGAQPVGAVSLLAASRLSASRLGH